MAGELVPLVLVPRYSTFAGGGDYTTIGMDVTEYQNAIVNVWRQSMLGTGGTTFTMYFEESTDQANWYSCSMTAGSNPVSPLATNEAQCVAALKKRWFRLRLQLGGGDTTVTCWAVGALEQRTD